MDKVNYNYNTNETLRLNSEFDYVSNFGFAIFNLFLIVIWLITYYIVNKKKKDFENSFHQKSISDVNYKLIF